MTELQKLESVKVYLEDHLYSINKRIEDTVLETFKKRLSEESFMFSDKVGYIQVEGKPAYINYGQVYEVNEARIMSTYNVNEKFREWLNK